MHKFFRFLYLNIYSFLILFCGIIIVLLPFYRYSNFLLIPQILISLFCFIQAYKLFSSWKDKKIKYQILIEKNKNGFRPDSFIIFMKAPCGRLLTKSVLKDLNFSDKYQELLVYKQSFFNFNKNTCSSSKTTITFYEETK